MLDFLGRFYPEPVYDTIVMAITTKRTRFSRRLPDHVTDELVNVLTEKKVFGFNDLFERVFANLKLRNAVSGGEEMLRLRAYEKLQNLVTRGLVEKIGKEYKGTTRVHEASSAYAAAQEAAAQDCGWILFTEFFQNPRSSRARVFSIQVRVLTL